HPAPAPPLTPLPTREPHQDANSKYPPHPEHPRVTATTHKAPAPRGSLTQQRATDTSNWTPRPPAQSDSPPQPENPQPQTPAPAPARDSDHSYSARAPRFSNAAACNRHLKMDAAIVCQICFAASAGEPTAADPRARTAAVRASSHPRTGDHSAPPSTPGASPS